MYASATAHEIDCPKCDAEITVHIIPGEPMVLYYPDGSGYPGSPPELDEIEGCECLLEMDCVRERNRYEDHVMERAADSM